jgi:hypothetical protein
VRQGMVGLVLAAIAVIGGDAVNAQGAPAAVRPEHAAIRALIASGLERSATFRDLNARLDRSDVVVYIRFSRCTGRVSACLVWGSAGNGIRRLLISLDRFGRSPDELTAMLAHELQHANEVAAASEITDVDSFQKSFATGGWRHGTGFETAEATRITRQVAAELSRPVIKGGA